MLVKGVRLVSQPLKAAGCVEATHVWLAVSIDLLKAVCNELETTVPVGILRLGLYA